MENVNAMIFKNDEFTQLRVFTDKDNNIYFNLYDVSWSLGYVRPDQTGKMYLRKDRIKNICETLDITVYDRYGQKVELTTVLDFEQLYISESGFYDLALESKAKHARKFRKWVVEEVIPSIRKKGYYSLAKRNTVAVYKAQSREELLALALLEAQKVIEEMKPKSDYYDTLVATNHLTSIRDTAKELKIPERQLVRFLINNGILYRDKNNNLKPYSEYVQKGYFELKDWTNGKVAGVWMLITPQGKQFILDIWKKYNSTVIELDFSNIQ